MRILQVGAVQPVAAKRKGRLTDIFPVLGKLTHICGCTLRSLLAQILLSHLFHDLVPCPVPFVFITERAVAVVGRGRHCQISLILDIFNYMIFILLYIKIFF